VAVMGLQESKAGGGANSKAAKEARPMVMHKYLNSWEAVAVEAEEMTMTTRRVLAPVDRVVQLFCMQKV